jgi:protease I
LGEKTNRRLAERGVRAGGDAISDRIEGASDVRPVAGQENRDPRRQRGRRAFNHLDKGDTFTPDKAVGEADPDDLDAFNAKIVEELAEDVHEGQRESASAGA